MGLFSNCWWKADKRNFWCFVYHTMVFKKYLSIAFTNSEQNKFYLANSKPLNWNAVWTVQTAFRWKIAIKEDISSADDTTSVIAYIGSNCCYNINKKLNCEVVNFAQCPSSDEDETTFNHSLFRGISGGNLLYPNADIKHIRLISNIVIQKIACFEKFLRLNSQRALSLNSF